MLNHNRPFCLFSFRSILSVTVWFRLPATSGAVFHYTLDGSTPTIESQTIGSIGGPILLNKLGKTVVKCFASKDGMEDSVVVTRTYTILGRCSPPFISPNYGTFENEVVVKFHTPTPKGRICFAVDSSADPGKDSTCVEEGGSFRISTAGRHTIRAVTVAEGMADSSETEVTLHIVLKVAAPVITPEINVFPIVAMLTVKCSTPDATLFYSLDRTIPTQSSYTIANGGNIIIDSIGSHTLKVMAIAPGMISSNITTKDFIIQRRMVEPQLLPRPGTYTGDLSLILHCPETAYDDDDDAGSPQAPTQGRVYYTLDGVKTPSEKSDSVPCGEAITLTAPRTVIVRAMAVQVGKATSSVVQGVYVLVRPRYEEHPVNPVGLQTFSVQPDVSIMVVEKNIPEVRSYCSARNNRGRLIVLRNPVGHFDIVPPVQGCSSGKLELPSVSGRPFRPASGFNLTSYIESKALQRKLTSQSVAERIGGAHLRRVTSETRVQEPFATLDGGEQQQEEARLRLDNTRRSELPAYLKALIENGNESTIRVSTLAQLGQQYGQVEHLGCQIVSNAGFFNVTSKHCLGDIVTTGTVQQLSDLHNVNFGIRNGSFVVGYVEKEEILDPKRPPFDFLVSGLGWLVRGGKSYVAESFSAQGDKESMAAQSNGPQFLSVHSARTALGHDAEGNLMLLQVEGETWVRGMSLYEFAEFAVELGFYSAINLDGGGSATLTQNHSLISEPSWKCSEAPYNSSEFYRCEKRVSSITCIHAMAPPFVDQVVIDRIVHPRSPAPTMGPTAVPTAYPSAVPSWMPTIAPTSNSTQAPVPKDEDNEATINSTAVDRQLLALQSSVRFYELSAVTLLVILLFSICAHVLTCIYYYDTARRKARSTLSADRSEPPRNEVEPPSPGGLQMMPMATVAESPMKFPPAPFQFSPPSQGIASQYSAIPSDGPAKAPGGILSYLPSLTGSATKRLGETQPEPAPRNVATSPRSLSRHQSQQPQQHQPQPEEELRDIADWKPPSSGLLLAHLSPAKSTTSTPATAAGYSFGRTKEEEDFYRDDEEDDDCTDSSRLLRAAPAGAPTTTKTNLGAHHHHSNVRRSQSRDSDSGSSEEGQGSFVRRPVALKVPKSSGKLKAKSAK